MNDLPDRSYDFGWIFIVDHGTLHLAGVCLCLEEVAKMLFLV